MREVQPLPNPSPRRGGATAVALGLLVLVTGCVPKADPAATGAAAEPPPIPVTVAPVATRELPRAVSAVGTLYGYDEVILAPKVDGRVTAVLAVEGDTVAPGARLLELEDTDYRLAVTEARQGLAAELAKLGLDALPAGDVELSRVPAVRRAAVALEDAQRRQVMKRDLLARAAVSRDEYDLADTEARLADATRVQMETEARAVLAAARLKQASLELAEQKLRDTVLYAPVPGELYAAGALVGGAAVASADIRYKVARRYVSVGKMVRGMPETNAFELVIDYAVKLRASVPERFAPSVKPGQLAEVRVDAYPGRTFVGRVAWINPKGDSANRAVEVEIRVPNADGALRSGWFARASIGTRVEPVRTVPADAVYSFAGVDKVFVIDNGRARAVVVAVGVRDRDWVEVVADLPAGARVATSGLTQLTDGAAVRVR